jgi:hypothetical protein
MTTVYTTVPDSRIGKLVEKLFKLDSNFSYLEKVKQQEKVKQRVGMIKRGCFSVERSEGEVKMAEYFLEHEFGSSGDLTEAAGVTISQMSSLSPYDLHLVDRERDPRHRHYFIYHRIVDREKLPTYINLMNELIKEIEDKENC